MLSEDIQIELGKLYDAALIEEKAGKHHQAVALYAQCLSLDPADHCGASVRIAAMGLGERPQKAPDAYVKTLFDQHADVFDDILTGKLGYAVPIQLADILMTQRHEFSRMLDLGCGTGLSGMTLAPICDYAVGVDISSNMIDEADERQCYDALFINEAVHFLEEWQHAIVTKAGDLYQPFDLIVATDVLPYIGALEPLFNGVSNLINKGGCFAFSCETMTDDAFEGEPWRVTPHQRFAHQAEYIKALLIQHDFNHLGTFQSITVRTEEGKSIPGWLVVAWKETTHD